MSDKWPSVHENLSLDNHLLWRFQQLDDDGFIKFWITWPGHSPSQVDIPIACMPALACFDLEYWITMEMAMEGEVKLHDAEIFQKYMQNTREAIVEDILKSNNEMRRDGSWSPDSIHEWSVRTLSNCSHSYSGRQEYMRKCKSENILPYGQDLTLDDWRQYFRTHSSKYTSDGHRLQERMDADGTNIPGIFARDVLRSLNMLPSHQTTNIYGLLSRKVHEKASIHLLPNELLDLIMFHLVDLQWSSKDVLPIASVCHRWRDLADNCPELWHRIEISGPPTQANGWSPPTFITSKQLVEKYLLKSRRIALDITIHFTVVCTVAIERRIFQIVETLFNHAHRWKFLTIRDFPTCDTTAIDGGNMSCIHHLSSKLWNSGALSQAHKMEGLHIYCTSPFHYDAFHLDSIHLQPPDTFQGDFNLRDLRIDTYIGRFPAPLLRHITRLSISDPGTVSTNWLSMLAMLDDCPALTHLTLRQIPYRVTLSSRLLPQLLEICLVDVQHPECAFDSFVAPVLQSIEVLSKDVRLIGCPSHTSFLRLCGSEGDLSQIRHLDVSGLKITNSELDALLSACSSALHIAFRADPDDEARTAAFKHIRESLGQRFVIGKVVTVVISGWIGRGKKNGSAMVEWQRLQRLGETQEENQRTIFTFKSKFR